MESKKINQLATELAPELSDLTIIGDPTTGISKKITLSQMASLFTGTVEEYPNLASFPLVGTADTIYIALDTNIIYRWNTGTSAYVELSPNIVTSLVFNDANGFDGTISLVGSTATLTITTALTQGSIGFIGASGALTQDNSNFFWDNTNKRLGINTNAPTTAIDAFGSGIIGRLNGTSTNNAFLGFASAGSNKWSIGNVQSDHRFRIYNEATTSELVSVLQTGEFGIGIANPLTKLHIFGGASALIANLDANTSVAKSISFRSGNSSRINLEVSGTESGSNAGADLFVRTYTDAGALLATPLTITRSTGAITLTGALSGTTATFSSDVTLTKLTSATGLEYQVRNTNGASGNHVFKSFNTSILTLDGGTNYATFSSNVNINGETLTIGGTTNNAIINNIASIRINIDCDNNGTGESFIVGHNQTGINDNNLLFKIKDDGNVGIATASPNIGGYGSNSRVLTIQGVSGSYGILELTSNSANADGNAIGRLDFGSDGQAAGYKAISSIASFLSGSTSTKFGADLRFYTRANNAVSGDPVERMRIGSNGFVGIGSTNPSSRLYVQTTAGSTKAYDDTTKTNILVFDDTSMAAGVGGSITFGGYKTSTTNGGNFAAIDGVKENGTSGNEAGAFRIWTANGSGIFSEKLRVASGGNIGINTTSPNHRLEVNVNGTNGSTAAIANLFGGSNIANQNCYLYLGNTNVGMSATVDGAGTPRNNLYAFANGAGVVLNSGATSWTSNSDETIKDIIEPITNAIDKIINFRTVVYKFKNEEDKRRLGLIAQDVELSFPEIVSESYSNYFEKDVKGVAYTELIPVIIKAIQELNDKIENLR